VTKEKETPTEDVMGVVAELKPEVEMPKVKPRRMTEAEIESRWQAHLEKSRR